MLQNALVPVDGSQYMTGLVAHAIGFGKRTHCTLTFLYVVDIPSGASPAEIEVWKSASIKLPDECREKAAAEGISAKSRTEVGSPAETIVTVAEREKFDIIIIGSKGHSRLKSLVVGSVADQVMEHAPCPVLLAR